MNKMKIAAVNFDHMHMGDLLRMASTCADAQIVGVSDHQPGRAEAVLDQIGLPRSLFAADYAAMLTHTKPDLVILCSSTATHADWVEKVALHGTHILVEKPFAASLDEADQMIAAPAKTGKAADHQLAAAVVRIARDGQTADRRGHDR